MKKKSKAHKKVVTILFYLYIISLTYFLFFSEYLNRGDIAQDYRMNTELFREIKRYLLYWRVLGIRSFMINIPGNIIAFMPFGFLVPYINEKYRRFWTMAILSFFFSQTIEVVQLITKVGCFDVDDIFLNTIGGIIGYICYKIFAGTKNKKRKKKSK